MLNLVFNMFKNARDIWDVMGLLTLICFPIFCLVFFVWMIWLVKVEYPKEKKGEEALKNALNRTTKFSFWDP